MNCGACFKPGRLSGLTTNIYWLSYFPNRFRFQFNGHNIIVLREIENGFRVSDPVLDHPVDCLTEDLERARFASGPLEPHGFMYYPKSVNPHPDLRTACIKGMKDTCNMMLKIPLPIFGIRGIRYLAKRTIKSPEKLGFEEACRQSGQYCPHAGRSRHGRRGIPFHVCRLFAGSSRTVRLGRTGRSVAGNDGHRRYLARVCRGVRAHHQDSATRPKRPLPRRAD